MQLLLLSFILPVVLGSAIPGQEKCAWGPPYWCSHVSHARECGATQHCLQTVWKNQIIKPESTATCTYCQLIVNSFRDALEDKATQAQIKAVLVNACAILPDPDTRDMCQQIVEEYVLELVQMFENDITTDMICATLGLCSGLEDRWSPYGVKASNDSDCSDCIKFFQDVQDAIKSKETLNQLLQLFNQTVCSELGGFSEICIDLMKQYLPVALQTIADQIDPDIVCRVFGFCTTEGGVKQDVIKIKNIFRDRRLKNQNVEGYKLSDEECDICKDLIGQIDDIIKDKTNQDKVKYLLENHVCTELGSFADECKQLVEEYAPMFFEVLVNELDPTTLCEAIGFCKVPSLPKAVLAEQVEPASMVGPGYKQRTAECELCKFFVKEIDRVLEQNETIETVKEFLDKICERLPDEQLKNQCVAFVNEYEDLVLKLVIKELDPEQRCEDIGACSKSKVQVQKITDGKCQLCVFAITEAEELVANMSAEELLNFARGLCNKIPTFSATCLQYVDQYGDIVISLLKSGEDPTKLCQLLKLCTGSHLPYMTKPIPENLPTLKVPSKECEFCDTVVIMLKYYLANNASKAELKNILEGFCKYIPSSLLPVCQDVVEEYGDRIIDLIDSELNATEICTAVGLCKEVRKQAPILSAIMSPYDTLPLGKPLENKKVSVKKPSWMCEYCDTVVIMLKYFLKNNASEEEMKKAMEGVCTYLPTEVASLCQFIVEKYADDIISMVVKNLNANQICSEVGLCKDLKKYTSAVSVVLSPYDTLPLVKPLENRKVTKFSDQCELCEDAINMLKSYIGENATKAEIEKEVEVFCTKVPSAFKAECDNVIETYGSKIVDLLLQEADTRIICVVIKLCDEVLSPSEIMSPYNTLPVVGKKESTGNAVECYACKEILEFLDKELQDNRTEANIKAVLKDICEKLPGSLTTQCTNFVDKYAQSVINFLVLDLSPEEICQKLTLCPAVVKKLPEPVHIKLLKDVKETSKSTAGPSCVLCEFVIKEVDDILKGNKSEAAVISALDKICSFLPDTINKECVEFVDTYSKIIIQLLVNNIDPEEICTRIGLCSAKSLSPLETTVKIPPGKVKETSKSTAGPSCVLCEFIIKEVDDILKGNKSEAAVISALDKICSFLPDTINKECVEFVDTYSKVIIQMLVNNIDPEEICTRIGLCSAKSLSPLAATVNIQPGKVKELDKLKSSPECVLCEFVMKELDDILQNNKTEAEIKAALEKVCSVLPSTLTTECIAFVNKYEDLIIALIVNDLKPAEICTLLQLCSSGKQSHWGTFVKILPDRSKASPLECPVCKLAMEKLQEFLKENRTRQEVEEFLQQVCSLLPDTVSQQCHDVLDQYIPAILALIDQNLKPEQICEKLKLCNATETHKKDDNTLFYKPQRLVGLNKCTYGPAYWCANKDNAAKCNAMEHCKRHVWN